MDESILGEPVTPARQPLLEQLYAAFNGRDIDAVLRAFHPDVDWPNAWEGGRVHGRDAVRAYWERQWAVLDPRVTPVAFSSGANGETIVEVHALIRDHEAKVLADHKVLHIYFFEGGLVRRMEIGEI